MFTPRELALERGWPGKLEGDRVIQVAAQTLEAFFTGGGRAREHNVYPLSDVALRAPVLRPPSIRFFADGRTFWFGNTASIYGPEDDVPAPAPTESRFSVAAVVGAEERLAGFTLVNDWRAPSLAPPKDRRRIGRQKLRSKKFGQIRRSWRNWFKNWKRVTRMH